MNIRANKTFLCYMSFPVHNSNKPCNFPKEVIKAIKVQKLKIGEPLSCFFLAINTLLTDGSGGTLEKSYVIKINKSECADKATQGISDHSKQVNSNICSLYFLGQVI